MIIAMIGNVETGFKFVGPFIDEGVADRILSVDHSLVKFMQYRLIPVATVGDFVWEEL